ncbi:UNVERIFIED_CONTAM: hypothetical protein K2H54_062522 [Gekko kuhli]
MCSSKLDVNIREANVGTGQKPIQSNTLSHITCYIYVDETEEKERGWTERRDMGTEVGLVQGSTIKRAMRTNWQGQPLLTDFPHANCDWKALLLCESCGGR